ncbi:polysaccharide biosynthesis/export family protein [Hydrocarboniphaga sp.]|uniref:polysaccharide biosynthesis/export family protein n=1 Tax=Hydrocarboniphaga sp. TaxID=2033016 RepID=UPI00262AE30F|nr:polysaccharide biosynthesis/export family protein [Hydrocarboniphaga sp.]
MSAGIASKLFYRRHGRRSAAIAACLLASACSTMPTAGPSTRELRDEGAAVLPFKLVEVSASTVAALAQQRGEGLAARFGDDDALPALLVGSGDGLTVNLWETGANPLFSLPPASGGGGGGGGGRGTTIPEQIVDADGSIAVPYAGRIAAAGRTPAQIQAAIEKALSGKTQSPQALVSVTRPAASAVTLLGEGVGGLRLPLSARGERVLDALAAAGGSRAPVYDTRVQLTRGGVTASLPLSHLLDDPAENLRLHPGDELVVTREPASFTVFGATGRNAQIDFDAKRLNLIEAVAKSGGLLDQRADPQGVFLFRYEPAPLAASLAGSAAPADAAPVPVVYQLDLNRAGSYFLGQSFAIRDRDVLYVASAPANELQKFLVLLGLVSQPVINGVIINQASQ